MAEGLSTPKMIILLVLVTVLGTSSALFLHWRYGGEEPKKVLPELENLNVSPILHTDKDKYQIGDTIQVEIALNNSEKTKVELRRIEYNLTIYETGQEIYWINVDHDFTKPIQVESGSVYWIPVGQTWKQMDQTNKQVPPGTYVIKVRLLPYNQTTSKKVIIDETG